MADEPAGLADEQDDEQAMLREAFGLADEQADLADEQDEQAILREAFESENGHAEDDTWFDSDGEPFPEACEAMDVERPPAAAVVAPATAELPSFASSITACAPVVLQEQLAALEAVNMEGFVRNGDAFEAYFKSWDLRLYTATSAAGQLLGFAISGAEGRGKVFLYELHIHKDARGCGLGRKFIDLVESSGTPYRGSTTMELNVHKDNPSKGFYERLGFDITGEASSGLALVMRRKRKR